jgi:hypothetical protein
MSASSRGARAPRSLLVFVQALEGLTLLVELRNDTVVRGRVESVDDAMKCVRRALGNSCWLTRVHLTCAHDRRSIIVADAVCETLEVRAAARRVKAPRTPVQHA